MLLTQILVLSLLNISLVKIFDLHIFHIIQDTSQDDWHHITNPHSDTNHFVSENEGSMLIQTNQFDAHICGTLQSECILRSCIYKLSYVVKNLK